MSPKEALDLVFLERDTDEEMTIRDYFKLLLNTLFEEGEGFSGKRPLGNSDWETGLEQVLVANGCIKGEIVIDDDDPDDVWVNNVDVLEYDKFVLSMVEAL